MSRRPQPTLLIDGYNLLHAAGLARETYGPGDLERARDRLISRVRQLLDERQIARTVIVFDAKESVTFHGSAADVEGVRVVFPDRGVEADTVLEEMIRSHSAPKQLRVVSSDHRVRSAASRRRATPVDSDRFLRDAADAAARRRGPEKPTPGSVRGGEVRHWVDELNEAFGVSQRDDESG